MSAWAICYSILFKPDVNHLVTSGPPSFVTSRVRPSLGVLP
ncbi:MAG: hypothetical protein RLZ25_2032 [Pseudomonadota bacterium]|jgi:hypothetical protein